MNFEQMQTKWPKLNALPENPIAYFCAEFALADQLPIYSGGLGVLAGDVVREADSEGLPLVGIGLFYKQGYFKQVITDSGMQDELPAYPDISKLPLTRVPDAQGNELRIKLSIAERIILVRAWRYSEGNTPVFLLDTDIPENQELDRRLTLSLYPSSNDWRIQQEIILGIGGARLLQELSITPSVYHLNEGHSAFAVLEVAHQHMQQGKASFEDSFRYACNHTVFTNHTLIPSGNDMFPSELVSTLLGQYANHLGLPIDEIVRMGSVPRQPGFFSMTHLALTASSKVSAVSKSHAQFAKVTWPDSTLIPITNGVHVPYWQTSSWQSISDKVSRGFEVSDEEIWNAHKEHKTALLKKLTGATGAIYNPDALTITWARRVTGYKQPLLLFSDVERLSRILEQSNMPIQILISGKAHPSDSAAKEMIADILDIIEKNNLGKNIAFLPNYNLELARLLIAGSDVWLNTPIKGQEACGTSGMKSSLNGVLQCAISDGWTDEVDLAKIGFPVSPIDSATSLYNSLEQTIAPLYYNNRNSANIPEAWAARMRDTATVVTAEFSATRMLAEYVEKLYLPTL